MQSPVAHLKKIATLTTNTARIVNLAVTTGAARTCKQNRRPHTNEERFTPQNMTPELPQSHSPHPKKAKQNKNLQFSSRMIVLSYNIKIVIRLY